MSGPVTNLLTGLATYIASGGIGATWKANGAYTTLETAIVLGSVPQSPDRIIAMTAYGVGGDDPTLSDTVTGLQVLTRCSGTDKRLVDDLQDSIFNLLHGVSHLVVGTSGKTVHVVQCLRASGPAALGQDENHRWVVSSNYLVTVHRPSPHRT